ncbi:Uncharacterised protein [Mycobacterium tuberculosis]|nr:Uncharacterised protein [Mycobacterium tuberculosis]
MTLASSSFPSPIWLVIHCENIMWAPALMSLTAWSWSA